MGVAMGKNLFKLVAALCALALVAAACGSGDDDDAGGGTLASVQDNDVIECGGNDTLPGFGIVDADGGFSGFDIDYCAVIAAGVLGDSSKVNVTPLVAAQRFPTLQSGEIDVLIRNTTWTASRDGSEQANFLFTTFYDGQGFMAPADSGITTLADVADTS
ncbi:MAG: transporter substrate-binding domain-containing protein, partial [Actinomycetota bacterium]